MAKDKSRGAVKTQQRGVALSRLHSAEAALAGSRIREAELLLVQAQKGLQDAHAAASRVCKAILVEMKLSTDNLIDIEALAVRPPQGQEYVVEQDD
jgi:hypothetical protein